MKTGQTTKLDYQGHRISVICLSGGINARSRVYIDGHDFGIWSSWLAVKGAKDIIDGWQNVRDIESSPYFDHPGQ